MFAIATVLIIEDEPDIRSAVVETLQDAGYTVLDAENGRVGVALAVAEQPDLIVCDVSMPELDGYGVLAELRQYPQTATVPFIFVSARGDRRDVRAGMNLGADDYITKPFTPEELLEAVQARLRARVDRTPTALAASGEATLPAGGGTVVPRVGLGPADVIAGRFEIERRAGSGGMATVFRARDLEQGIPVAIKVLHDPGDRIRMRFAREAEVLASLRHPHIVRYINHGVTPGGDAWMAMEWLEGEDLAQRLARGPMSIPDAVGVARRAADALGAAHVRGVLHRDVKPGNLFLVGGLAERLKLLDFGVARVLAEVGRATRTGTALGTPSYMAPEQATAARDVDARVDVFSLGCVLFEMLAGWAPFQGDNVMAVLSRVLFEDAPRLRDARPEVPPELDALVARMTARDPDLRPADGHAAAAELLRFDLACVMPGLATG